MAARNNEATAIASVVAKAIADSPDRQERPHHSRAVSGSPSDPAAKGKVLDTVDFRKDSQRKVPVSRNVS